MKVDPISGSRDDSTKMARRKGQQNYPPAIRQAVLAALLAGQGVEEVARQFNIPPDNKPLARFFGR